MKNKILITGGAGFIGFHLSKNLIASGFEVVGIDNLNNYYDVNLKLDRVNILKEHDNYKFLSIDICNKGELDKLFEQSKFDYVVNLAAQAGVRFSIEQPYRYVDSNLIGFINILEACRENPIKHLIFASSSSVYGANKTIPFSTDQPTDQPLSLYAATKKANEMMAHSYAAMYKIPCTGLRFFTVYGPFGRPDMAYFSFTKDILAGKPIKIFNNGNMRRDFTYVDDIVAAINGLLNQTPNNKDIPYQIFNIGNNSPVNIGVFIETLEKLLNRNAIKEYLPMQKGDMIETYADVSQLEEVINYRPSTSLTDGLKSFVTWYRDYYK